MEGEARKERKRDEEEPEERDTQANRGIWAHDCVLRSLPCRMPSLQSQHGFACLVFVFGLCINDVLRSDIATVARDLDVVDGFCGEGAIHKSAAQKGFRAEAFDKFRILGVTDLSV